MQLPSKEKLLWPIGLLGLASVLIVLAVLQYRWSQELTDAASDRMRAGLQSSMMGFREDLSRELQSISQAFQPSSGLLSSEGPFYAKRFENWKSTAVHSGLVSGILIADRVGKGKLQLYQFNLATREFEPVEWPSRLLRLRDSLAEVGAEPQMRPHRFEEPPPRFARRFERFKAGDPPSPPWLIDESIPALVHAEIDPSSDIRLHQSHAPAKIRWVVIDLDENVLRQEIVPELAQRYFGSSDGLIYEVAVTSRTGQNRVLYSSDPHFGTGTNVATDAQLNLFGPPIGLSGAPRDVIFRQVPLRTQRPEFDRRTGGHGWALRIEPLSRSNGPEGDWQLIVKHRKGSLEAALASTRRGHLIISSAVLLVLAITMAMIIVASRRAHRLASLQMQFVTGVSHELRTPLAVIASAADNIADGIVEDKHRVARYGKVIRDQSRQLTQLVEQILLFAATGQNRHQYNFRRVPAVHLVEVALANSADLIHSAGFTVERENDCPADVLVDVPAVAHCLQNLIANAVKYGGDARWIGVRVEQTESPGNGREVRISVQDRGLGIAPKEQQRIFDAFYRSPAVIGAQIHGTGLGLALANRIAAGMRGRLSVTSRLGKGSTFVLHLPCVEPSAQTEQEATSAAASS